MTVMAHTGGAPGDSERCNEGGRGIAAATGMVVARRVFPALVIGKLLLGASVNAATLVVDDLDDPGTQDDRRCSLREALNAVNGGAEDADDCKNMTEKSSVMPYLFQRKLFIQLTYWV